MIEEEQAGRRFSGREIETAFVSDHWRYGSLVHQRAAEWLVGALTAEREPVERHVLFSRLFGEFAGTLETYAGWAWSLRNRFEKESFLDAYLSYTNADVGNFYKLVAEHERDLSDLLGLPASERIVELTMARSADLAEEGYRESLRAQYDRLKEAAGMYFQTDRVIIDAYNKTKHGAPMIRLFDRGNPTTYEIILRNPDRGQGQPPYRFASFTVDDASIEKQRSNVEVMTTHIRDLAAVTTVLLDAGVLYEQQAE